MADVEVPTVEYLGKTYRLRTDKMSQSVMGRFFALASTGDEDTTVPDTLLVALVEQCIEQGKETERFWKNVENDDDIWGEGIQVLLSARMEWLAEHPTGLPSVSTERPQSIPPKSVIDSDAKVIELSLGRVDRYAMLREAQTA